MPETKPEREDAPEDQPLPELGTDDPVVKATFALVYAPTTEEAAAIVRRLPEPLLGDEADHRLWQVISLSKEAGYEPETERYRDRRDFLRRCRREGVERASAPDPIPAPVAAAVAAFAGADTDGEAGRVIQGRERELYHPDADRRLESLALYYQDDWPLARALHGRRGLLAAFRRDAADVALNGFLKASPRCGRARFARDYPALFTPEAARVVAAMSVTEPPDKAARRARDRVISDYRTACKKAGVDFAPPAVASPAPEPGAAPRRVIPPEFAAEGAAVRALEVRLAHDPSAARELVLLCEQILDRLAPGAYPEFCAALQSRQAKGLFHLPDGDRGADLARAIGLCQDALRALTPEFSLPLYENVLMILGECYLNLPADRGGPDRDGAITCLQALLRQTDPGRDPAGYAKLQQKAGRLHAAGTENSPNALRKASACFKDALRALPDGAEPELFAALKIDLGNVSFRLGMIDREGPYLSRAADRFMDALCALPPWADPELFVEAHYALGVTYLNRPSANPDGQFRAAIRSFREALRVCTPGFDAGRYAEIQNRLGSAYRRLPTGDAAANLTQAVVYYEEALRYYKAETSPVDYARIMNNLGTAYAAMPGDEAANLAKAIDAYKKALRHCPPEVDPVENRRIHNNLAVAYVQLSTGDVAVNRDLAIDALRQSATTLPARNSPYDQAANVGNLGASLIKERNDQDVRKAIGYLELALEVHTLKAFPREYAGHQINLGAAYASLQSGSKTANLEEAIACMGRALKVFTPATDAVKSAIAQQNRGAIYERLADYLPPKAADRAILRAIVCYRKALKVFTPEVDPYRYGDVMSYLGNAYALRPGGDPEVNFAEAVQCFGEALTRLTVGSDPDTNRRVQILLGKLYADRGRWAEALDAYRKAIEADELQFRAGLTSRGQEAQAAAGAEIYPAAAFAAARHGSTPEALLLLERGRARALSDALRLGVPRPPGVPDDAWDGFSLAAADVRAATLDATPTAGASRGAAAYDARVAAASRARDALDAAVERVRAHAPGFLRGLDRDCLRSLTTDDRTALVSLCVTSRGALAFLLSPGADAPPPPVELPRVTSSDLNRLTLGEGDLHAGWLTSYIVSRREPERWRPVMDAVLAEVGERLLAPVVAALPDHVSRLVFLGGGLLALLPLHAVPLPLTTPGASDQARLGDRYELSYAPSLQVLADVLARSGREAGHGLIALVNPHDDPQLPYSSTEAAAIAGHFPGATVLEGRDATREACLAGAPGRAYLHFSCHGSYQWLDPGRSGLELADDRLTLDDLRYRSVDLSSARLVTLSACETGLTDVLRGSEYEYVGLPAGFLLAGVPCVVSSLWEVPEMSTSLLMRRLYDNHLGRKLSVPAALAEAQVWVRELTAAAVADLAANCASNAPPLHEAELINRYRSYQGQADADPNARPFAHPYFWAAFTVNGVSLRPDANTLTPPEEHR